MNRAFERLFYLGPFLLIGLSALLLWLRWDQIPGRFPIHWDANGRPNGWGSNSFWGVGFPLVIAVVINIFILTIVASMSRKNRGIYAEGEAAALEGRARRVMFRLCSGICYFITMILCGFALWLPFRAQPDQFPGFLIIFLVLGEFGLLVYVFLCMARVGEYLGQAKKAVLASGGSGADLINERNEDRFWKWGLIYFNPGDPAVWVEKRHGIGWTTNMAHRQGWTWLIGLLTGTAILVLGIIGLTSSGGGN